MTAQISQLSGNEYVANLVATASPEVLAAIQGELAATALAVGGINRKLEEAHRRVTQLDAVIRKRKRVAVVLKATSLLGGAIILADLFPVAVRVIGLVITMAGIADLVLGNHKRLLGAVDERNGFSDLIDSVEEVDAIGVTVMRLIGSDLRGVVKQYTDFMQKLQAEMSKGDRAVRQIARDWERQALEKLEVPLPTDPSKGAGPLPKGGKDE